LSIWIILWYPLLVGRLGTSLSSFVACIPLCLVQFYLKELFHDSDSDYPWVGVGLHHANMSRQFAITILVLQDAAPIGASSQLSWENDSDYLTFICWVC
jgi:hypothetical protein